MLQCWLWWNTKGLAWTPKSQCNIFLLSNETFTFSEYFIVRPNLYSYSLYTTQDAKKERIYAGKRDPDLPIRVLGLKIKPKHVHKLKRIQENWMILTLGFTLRLHRRFCSADWWAIRRCSWYCTFSGSSPNDTSPCPGLIWTWCRQWVKVSRVITQLSTNMFVCLFISCSTQQYSSYPKQSPRYITI